MDSHCSTKCLGRECTMELVMSFVKEGPNRYLERNSGGGRYIGLAVENILGRIEHCLMNCNPLGCYIPYGDDISEKPHILICPERIKPKNETQFQDLLLVVIIHELTHAFFSTGSDLNDISKHIIEESLCEAYAFSKLGENEEIYEFRADHKRPPEYTAFKFWMEYSIYRPLIMNIVDWKNKDYSSFCNSFFQPLPRQFTFGSMSLEKIALTILALS